MTRRVCAWCREESGSIPDGPDGVTHGICSSCERRVRWEHGLARCVDAAIDGTAYGVLVAGYALAAWLLYDILASKAPASETMTVTATAYSWREPSHRRWKDKNAIGGSLTTRVEGLEHIAVDPSVIPLGSILDVEGAGRRIATDTGGAIHGRKIDVHTPTVAGISAWGKRRVSVEIVRRGWGVRLGVAAVGKERPTPDVRRGHAPAAKARSAQNPKPEYRPVRCSKYLIALDSKGRGPATAPRTSLIAADTRRNPNRRT